MKKILPILVLISLCAVSCKKDKGEPLPGVLLSDISIQLNDVANVSDFNSALKNLDLTAAETQGGITVFAPNDYTVITYNGSTIVHVAYSDEQLKDHIVKGKYTLADLRNKTTLKALSGKTLNISKAGGAVTVNGIPIKEEAVFSGNSSIVHVLQKAIDLDYPEIPEIIEVGLSEKDFIGVVGAVKAQLEVFQKSIVMMDALLSDEAGTQQAQLAGYSSYREFHAFQFTPYSSCVYDVWMKGYQTMARINYLFRSIHPDFGRKNELLAELRTMRAYTYLRLLNYFGNIVIVPEVLDLDVPLSNTNKQQVIDFIYADLAAADSVLEPLGKTPEINTYAVKALTAKLALYEKNYDKVIAYTDKVIDSQPYSLENKNAIFGTASKEIIWQLSPIADGPLKTFLNNRDAFPIIRLSELYLMNAEAQLAQGKPQLATLKLNPLLERHGLSGDPNTALLYNLWLKEMNREGISFNNLVRWGTASQVLPGFNHTKFNLLPIPERERMVNPAIIQNPGYF